MFHRPVLIEKIINQLSEKFVKSKKILVLDATFGEGHYTRKILGFYFL